VPTGKDGVYNVTVKGNLTIHGITKPIVGPATIELKGGKLLGRSAFKIKPEDYNIKIPSVVRDKIAKEISVSVQIDCNPK
jgi:polyisoprenoid-binding protein YceI